MVVVVRVVEGVIMALLPLVEDIVSVVHGVDWGLVCEMTRDELLVVDGFVEVVVEICADVINLVEEMTIEADEDVAIGAIEEEVNVADDFEIEGSLEAVCEMMEVSVEVVV